MAVSHPTYNANDPEIPKENEWLEDENKNLQKRRMPFRRVVQPMLKHRHRQGVAQNEGKNIRPFSERNKIRIARGDLYSRSSTGHHAMFAIAMPVSHRVAEALLSVCHPCRLQGVAQTPS